MVEEGCEGVVVVFVAGGEVPVEGVEEDCGC